MLEQAPNFRPVAGVRPGLVFRSGALHALTDADRATLADLGVRVAYDLRSDREREAEPTAAPALEQVHVALVGERLDLAGFEDGERFLAGLYLHLVDTAAARIGRILGALADPEHAPAVVHCSAGKDRTGIVCAVLQLAAGVDREVVLDDYVLTSRFQSSRRAEQVIARLGSAGIPAAVAAGLLGTPRDAMAAAVDRIGDVEAYLTGPAGLDAERLAALRARFSV